MALRRTHRLTTTILMVLALLFSQLALAGYVCPGALSDGGNPGMAAMEMGAGEPPCASMLMAADEEQPVLCHQHCVNAPQSFEPVQLVTLSLPAVLHVLIIPVLLGDPDDARRIFAFSGEPRPPPDPIFLSTLRLRV